MYTIEDEIRTAPYVTTSNWIGVDSGLSMRNLQPTHPLRLLLLAPAIGGALPRWGFPCGDQRHYDTLLRSVQRFRGRIYRKDGAIQKWQLDGRGGYRMNGDDRSWHLLLVNKTQEIVGCARYLVHPNTIKYEDLNFRHTPLARDRHWGEKVRSAFETELRLARSEGVLYVELGGWALAEEYRGTSAALRIMLASYAWGRLMGGARSACTATVRHGSASILRRIGGFPVEHRGEELPPYNDPAYGCQMEMIRFDCRHPNPRFLSLIHQLEMEMTQSPIITDPRIKRLSAPDVNSVPVAC
jgi:hypothetical protein